MMEIDLKRKHQAEIEDHKTSIENGSVFKGRVHYSTAVLELQSKADILGQKGFYKESRKLNKKVSLAKSIEQQKFNNKARQKVIQSTQALLDRQKSELSHLKGKMLG